MINEPKPRVDALLALYRETSSEITRLRNVEWRIAYAVWSLGVGVIALLTADDIQPLIRDVRIKLILTVMQLLGGVLGIVYIEITHMYLTDQRNIRRNIEELLGFHEHDSFDPNSILPAKWKAQTVTHWYQHTGLVVPLIISILYVEAIVIFLIWSITPHSSN